jgi:hypothetical protein
MTATQFTTLMISGALILSCQTSTNNAKDETVTKAPKEMVGNDQDEHGCKGSAGYTWSNLKQECIRIFEAGTAFTAFGKNTDHTLAAYVIISDDKTKAEVYIPKISNPILLDKANSSSNALPTILYINNNEQIKLTLTREGYFIEIKGEALYMQANVAGEGLNKLVSQ